MKWLSLFSALASLASAFVTWYRSRSADRAERAIIEGDEEAVNQDFNRLLRCILLLFALWLMAAGCVSKPAVPSELYMHRMERDGVPGWFVPDAQMIRIRQALAR